MAGVGEGDVAAHEAPVGVGGLFGPGEPPVSRVQDHAWVSAAHGPQMHGVGGRDGGATGVLAGLGGASVGAVSDRAV